MRFAAFVWILLRCAGCDSSAEGEPLQFLSSMFFDIMNIIYLRLVRRKFDDISNIETTVVLLSKSFGRNMRYRRAAVLYGLINKIDSSGLRAKPIDRADFTA